MKHGGDEKNSDETRHSYTGDHDLPWRPTNGMTIYVRSILKNIF